MISLAAEPPLRSIACSHDWEGYHVDYSDHDLQTLIATGKTQGFLTYDQVNAYLPDEAVSPEKLDNLLMALDEKGIDVVDEAPVAKADGNAKDDLEFAEDAPPRKRAAKAPAPRKTLGDGPKWSDDPIRLYLA